MESPLQSRQALESDDALESSTSSAVRHFLVSQGVKEHNHASEIARIIDVDRSQSYRRLKGDVAWSHGDLRAIARHFGAAEDHLLARDDLQRLAAAQASGGAEAFPAVLRVPRMPALALLVPGAELGVDESADLVAVRAASGWEVHAGGDEPFGARRYAVDSLTIRSHAHMQVALLEDDANAAEALVEAFRPLGIVATPFADGPSLLQALGSRRFDAFVLDWLLDEGTAARAVEAIRQHRPHVPVLVVTGALRADSDMERTLLELSARWNFSTVDKPVRPMNLANALKQLVSVAHR